MAASMIKKALILMILTNTRKDPKLKELKAIPEPKLLMMNQLFTRPVTSSSLQPLRNQSMLTTHIDSKLNLSLKQLMDLQLWKVKKFCSIKVFNFYLTFYVMQEVSL